MWLFSQITEYFRFAAQNSLIVLTTFSSWEGHDPQKDPQKGHDPQKDRASWKYIEWN